jgi:hypothetical protein
MKFSFAILFAALLFAGTAYAQRPILGIKGGVNFSNVHNSNNVEYDTKTGFHAGLLAHFHVSPQFAIQPEVLYSAQGAKFDAASINTRMNLGYINVPVMFQYMFSNGFRLEAGPQVGFLVSGKTEAGNVEVDIKDDLNTVDFGVGGGIGYISKSGLGIDARYNFGLTDINKDNSSNVKSQNRGVQVGLFYQFSRR